MATEIKDFGELNSIVTPEFGVMGTFEDADDELLPIAEYIRTKTMHNEYISPSRIKFLYTTKAKKEGGRYSIGTIVMRSDLDKMVNDDFDYIAIVFYPVWKDLDVENKVIQLDKLLCGIDTGSDEKPKLGKRQSDSREFVDNMKFFGPTKVLNSSEAVHLATERFIEEEKEAKTASKKSKQSANDIE